MTDPTLTPEFIAAQRARLEALRADLLGSERDAADTVRATTEERRSSAVDDEDAAQAEIQDDLRQGLHDLNNPRLAAIERALQKIDDGTYGRSDESNEPIPIARLEAVPEATSTVDEAEAREQRAKTGR